MAFLYRPLRLIDNQRSGTVGESAAQQARAAGTTSGCTFLRKAPKHGSAEYERMRAEVVPPYDVGKFPNKWRKMWRDQPARTLMAHIGKDAYSHIHYDRRQARTISVREAATLQSFPDGFTFCGTMNRPSGRSATPSRP